MLSKQLFIRLVAQDVSSVQWILKDLKSGEVADRGSASIEDLSQLSMLSQQYHSVMVISGKDVFYQRVSLANRSRLAIKALPYQIEDQISTPLDDVHVAHGNVADGQVDIAVISRALMTKYLEWIDLHQLDIRCLCADFQLLGTEASAAYLDTAVEPNRVLIKHHHHACSLTASTFPHWWAANSEQEILYFGASKPSAEGINLQPEVGDLLALLTEGYKPNKTLDLLQGDFQLKDRVQERLLQLRWPAALVFIALIFYSAILYTENLQLQQHSQQLNEAIKQQYLTAFPQAKRVVNPRVQMRNQLKALETAGEQQTLLTELHKVNQYVLLSGMRTERLDYKHSPQQLTLQLEASSFASFEMLETTLAEKKIAAKLGTLSQQNGQVTGRLIVGAK